MQLVTRSTWLVLICLSLTAFENAAAQVSVPGASAALRDGVLGRLGARRDARQQRLNRPAPPPQPSPSAARAPGARTNDNGQPETAPELNPRAAAARPATPGGPAGSVRSAQYAGQTAPSATAGVQPASAATPLPPNRLPSAGSVVSLRMPADLPGEVNYLVDGSQHMVIGAGEEQFLRAKPRYEIRFSRGIDDDGRSYGEAHYTVTAGAYRFAVTDQGWELYRDTDAPNAQQAAVAAVQDAAVPEPLQPSELSQLRHREPLNSVGSPAASTDRPLEQVQPAQSETLPTPTLRSILERE